MTFSRLLSVTLITWLLAACVSPTIPADRCPAGTRALPDCPPLEAVEDPTVDDWYRARTWVPASRREQNTVKLGMRAETPVQDARLKFLGGSDRDALNSLAVKIYMIEQARHSVDAAYYIFKDDLVGLAFLGALCNAVQRGVDVRLMVDSLGSISLDRNWLRALYHCQLQAGFIRNTQGQLTTRRARVQIVIFNAVSRIFANLGRRSHDKLMVVDGFVPEAAMVIVGGRNISLSYYGINADGSPNADTYRDAELLLRAAEVSGDGPTLGEVSEIYFDLLWGFKNNNHLQGRVPPDRHTAYPQREAELKSALATLKSLPPVAESMAAMPRYAQADFHRGEVRLAHEFDNLINKRKLAEIVADMGNNPNSIMYLLGQTASDRQKHVRVVSPYLFAARYHGPDGELLHDDAEEVQKFLEEDPERSYEIITNSVLTSDNFLAQSVVDMSMAPRVLLDEDLVERWQAPRDEGELNPALVDSERWQELVNHPRLKIYETGKLDDRLLGGDVDYGKLHSKYWASNVVGFIGTTNFDYRSRLFNNEMGFFFRSEGLTRDIAADFEMLKSKSYRWGSPEWLEMRRKLVEQGGMKGWTTKQQRNLFKFLHSTGLEWYF